MKRITVFAVAVMALLVFSVAAQAAVTVTISRSIGDVDAVERIRDISVDFDDSYPTNGESLTAANMALASVHFITCQPTSGYMFQYDYSAAKMKVFYTTGAQAVAASAANQPTVTTGGATASAVDATTPTVTIPAGFRSAVDASTGDEVGNTANLSSLTGVRCRVYGK